MAAVTETIRTRFGSEAGNWNALYQDAACASLYEHNVRERRKTALRFLGTPSGRVIDVGCGPGNVTLDIPAGPTVTGTDFAVPMLREAARSAKSAGRDVGFAASEATALPFGNASAAAVVALGLLEYVPEPDRVLRECLRVLSPGGTLVVSLPNALSPFILIDDAVKAAKNTVTRRLIPAVVRRRIKALLGKHEADYFTHKRHRFRPGAFRRRLEAMGFEIEAQRAHTFGFGTLHRSRLNLWICRKLESWTDTHANLERLGWTIVLKARKLS